MKTDGIHVAHSRTIRNSDDVFYSSDGDTVYKNTAAGFKTSLGLNNVVNNTDATVAADHDKIVLRDSEGDIFAANVFASSRVNIDGPSGTLLSYSDGTRTVYGGCDGSEPWFGTSSNHDLRLLTNSSERIRIEKTGNVGIGVTSPAYTLDVGGSANVGALTATDINAITTNSNLVGDNVTVVTTNSNLVGDNVTVVTTNSNLIAGNVIVDSNLIVNTDDLVVDTVNSRVGIGTASPKALTHIGKFSADSGSHNTIPSAGMGVSTDFPDSTHLWLGNHSNAEAEDYWGMALGTLYTGNSYIQTLSKYPNDPLVYYNLLLQPNGGNVGIGTTSPGDKLEIYRSGGSDNVGMITKNGSRQWRAGVRGDTNNVFAIQDDTEQQMRMVIDSSGNVGIGTTSPGAKLHVEHYGSAIGDFEGLRIANHATNLHSTSRPAYEFVVSDIASGTGIGSSKFAIGYRDTTSASRTDRLVIDSAGYVGIGTTSPRQKLEITNGNIALVSTSWKTSGNDDQLAGKIDFHLGGDSGQQSTPVASIEGYDKWQGSSYYGALAFKTHGAECMRIDQSGNVGIGTTTPSCPLHVDGYDSGSTGAVRYFNYSGYHGTGYYLDNVSLRTSHGILSGDYVAVSSDERIKKNIIDADDAECLDTLRLLKPKKYRYRDEITKGTDPVWGFIAQEVREILPHSTLLQKKTVPNIYELANVSSSNVITFTGFNTSDLESNATTLIKTSGPDDVQHEVHLMEIIDAHSIRVEEDLSDWIGSLDESGNVVAGNQLFVYGQEVDDFVFLKKEAIWTVATAALQEVDRQQQADKVRIAELESRIIELEGMVSLIKHNMTWPDE